MSSSERNPALENKTVSKLRCYRAYDKGEEQTQDLRLPDRRNKIPNARFNLGLQKSQMSTSPNDLPKLDNHAPYPISTSPLTQFSKNNSNPQTNRHFRTEFPTKPPTQPLPRSPHQHLKSKIPHHLQITTENPQPSPTALAPLSSPLPRS